VRRLDSSDALAQRILGALRREPGLRPRDLAALLEVHIESIERRLALLLRLHLVDREELGFFVHWFAAGSGCDSRRVRQLYAHLRYPARARLLHALAERPRGLAEVAREFQISLTALCRTLQPLVEGQIVDVGPGRVWRLAEGLGVLVRRPGPVEPASVVAVERTGDEEEWGWAGGT